MAHELAEARFALFQGPQALGLELHPPLRAQARQTPDEDGEPREREQGRDHRHGVGEARGGGRLLLDPVATGLEGTAEGAEVHVPVLEALLRRGARDAELAEHALHARQEARGSAVDAQQAAFDLGPVGLRQLRHQSRTQSLESFLEHRAPTPFLTAQPHEGHLLARDHVVERAPSDVGLGSRDRFDAG